ncbi:MAG: 3-isopropylmalate dehydratase large subunit [Rhodospirillales bacterium]|nr:3-isopropylmalate dehydratase large subunit [Alphaproteobacteria bacterium]MBL6947328.1 3-isopropylmalate dehydratase large subunit [Rhodospirillales bacterium]
MPKPMTLSEKIIAKAAGVESVTPGDIVTCAVDLAMMHDSSGPRRAGRMLDELGVPVWDKDKLVVITDHYTVDPDPASAAIQDHAREWVAEKSLPHFLPDQGICHVVLPENGFLKPGMFCVGGDSHSTTGGAFGAFMVGIGATELAGVLATGEIWVRVPETLRIDVTGKLAPGVAAKDVILKLCGDIGVMGANYMVVEYAGEAVRALSVDERMTLTNMAAELGAKTGIVTPDKATAEWLAEAGAGDVDIETWQGDDGAPVSRTITIDGAALAPQVAAPSNPENAADVTEYAGTPVQQAYIGACTGAKLEDLRMAADVVRGRTKAAGLRFFVAPASNKIRDAARTDGTLQTLEDAGALILPTGCGGCIGIGDARLEENMTGISSTNRNFVGRAGPASSKLYLGSPCSVAAAAITGEITDPREFIGEFL